MYTEQIEKDDTIYTVEEFVEYCQDGLFIDYDGFGHPIKDKLINPDICIYPSKLNKIPDDATHIVWYNR